MSGSAASADPDAFDPKPTMRGAEYCVALSPSDPGPSPSQRRDGAVPFASPRVALSVVGGCMRGWPLVTSIPLVTWPLASLVQRRVANQ
jgi:hypothetical protein